MKEVKGLLLKTLRRCRSMGSPRGGNNKGVRDGEKRRPLPPEGCFSVYVGAERERFVVRMECVNHPLFRMLLDEAETEYGYSTPGPLMLPCSPKLFREVLAEMKHQQDEEASLLMRCNLTRKPSDYHLLSPARPLTLARVYSTADLQI